MGAGEGASPQRKGIPMPRIPNDEAGMIAWAAYHLPI